MLRRTLAAALVLGLLTLAAGGARADLVTNGSFATGDFTGWTVSGDGIGIDSSFANTAAGDSYDAYFSATTGDTTAGTLSQAIATTPATSYDLSFSLLDEAGVSGDTFTVSFGGFTDILTGDQASPYQDGSDLYTTFSLSIPGSALTGTSTTLSFQGLNDPNSGIDWNLDDVSLVAGPTVPLPEPSALALFAGALALGAALRRRGLCGG